MTEQNRLDILNLTADIITSYTSKNDVNANDLPDLIQKVFTSLYNLSTDNSRSASLLRPKPAVPINKSIAGDYIVCLEDGKKMKSLKRYLKTSYNLTVEQYRERWGLPYDYPSVAPNYSKRRSEIAKEHELGSLRYRNNRNNKGNAFEINDSIQQFA
jgi:predicted transcriptional regulator